jgi:hypothetical protein
MMIAHLSSVAGLSSSRKTLTRRLTASVGWVQGLSVANASFRYRGTSLFEAGAVCLGNGSADLIYYSGGRHRRRVKGVCGLPACFHVGQMKAADNFAKIRGCQRRMLG